jgi:hypothetical protein
MTWVQFSDEDKAALRRLGQVRDQNPDIDRLMRRLEHYESEAQRDPTFIEAAEREYHRDGEVEIDNDAVVSASFGGAYVMAWVWVSNAEAVIFDDDEDEDLAVAEEVG